MSNSFRVMLTLRLLAENYAFRSTAVLDPLVFIQLMLLVMKTAWDP